MWRNRKFLIIGLLAVVALVGTLGGVAMAQTNSKNNATCQDNKTSLMEKVASIYQANTGTTIDPQELEKAFDQAQEEVCTEARDEFLNKLVEEGKITQEQADQWKAWLDARPEALTEEFKAWLEARPDIPELGKGGMFGGRINDGMMFFGSMHRGGNSEGFGIKSRICAPN